MNETRDNRQEIIRHGLRLFSRRGFDGTSTAEIVSAAGITKPTMYHYFGSKEGLLEDILREYYEPLIQELVNAATLPEDIALTFFRLARVYFDSALKSEDFFRLRAGIMLRDGEDTAYIAASPYITRESTAIRNYFDSAAALAGNIKGKEELCTITFIGTINAAISTYLRTGKRELLSDETIYKLRQQFLYGIYS